MKNFSLVATGGRLVFGGDVNGRFRAYDDETGKVLWETNLGSPVSGYPVTFSVAGKQYVVVALVEQGGHGSTTAAPIVRRIIEGLYGLTNTQFTYGGVTD